MVDEAVTMKGCNRLDLCASEMMVAMQEYVNTRLGVYAPVVTAVAVEDGRFMVYLTDAPLPKAK